MAISVPLYERVNFGEIEYNLLPIQTKTLIIDYPSVWLQRFLIILSSLSNSVLFIHDWLHSHTLFNNRRTIIHHQQLSIFPCLYFLRVFPFVLILSSIQFSDSIYLGSSLSLTPTLWFCLMHQFAIETRYSFGRYTSAFYYKRPYFLTIFLSEGCEENLHHPVYYSHRIKEHTRIFLWSKRL